MSRSHMRWLSRSTRRAGVVIALVLPALLLAFAPVATAHDEDAEPQFLEHPEVVSITVADRDELDELVDTGVDLNESVTPTDDGLEVEAVITESEKRMLSDAGFTIGDTLITEADLIALQEEREEMVQLLAEAEAEAAADGDELRVQRAEWFETDQGRFFNIEVWSSDGTPSNQTTPTLTVSFDAGDGTEIGDGQSFNLNNFADAGQYMYHRTNNPVPLTGPVPARMRVESSAGGVAVAAVTRFVSGVDARGQGAPPPRKNPHYQYSFVDHYVDATESTAKIEELAAEFPHLAEVVELPHQTNGYRRKAQAILEPRPVVVDAPSAAAGAYTSAPSSFGPAAPAGGISAAFAVVDDGSALPSEGCNPLVGFPAGAIALVDRGNCDFTAKVLNAQAAGAVAVLIVNNVPGNPTTPGGTAPGITIPSMMISQDDGTAIKAGLPATGTVRAVGSVNALRVVVESHDWGHEGGNDVTVALHQAGANQALSVDVDGDAVRVNLATDGSGAATSTAAQVVAALNSAPGSPVRAYTYRGNAGSGVALPVPVTPLSDGLNAPDSVSREPFTVKMIRIGKHRDGSKVGVLGYSQEHAREWVTPLVALETAERLLRNYAIDPGTKRLVDDLDIFIVPVVNPDGTHYSMYDYTLQRKNFGNYCGDSGDPLNWNAWGVDLNRNFRVGNIHQGYSGASLSCTSETYAGPSALSEPEARNTAWLAETFDNIRFSMNVHSHGGYFMWAPGAYQTPGRIQLPRPSFGTESFFYAASDHILNRIEEHRGTVVWPGRVGPISDVLYSAAGNSGDDLFYNHDIYAWSFEVGAPRRNAANTGWSSVGFTPPFEEGYEEAMEFSNGLIGMLEVARMYGADRVRPQATPSVRGGTHTGPVTFTFDLSEPADVYYTLDGSTPTTSSDQVEFTGVRQGQEPITVTDTTTVKWFAVDAAGNTSGTRTQIFRIR